MGTPLEQSSTPTVGAPVNRHPRSRVWLPAALVLMVAAAYGVFLGLPYYVNDLQRFPLSEVASGFHDPKDLWPRNTVLGGIWGLGGLLTLVLGPILLVVAVVRAAVAMWLER